jgi:hypothetical protein
LHLQVSNGLGSHAGPQDLPDDDPVLITQCEGLVVCSQRAPALLCRAALAHRLTQLCGTPCCLAAATTPTSKAALVTSSRSSAVYCLRCGVAALLCCFLAILTSPAAGSFPEQTIRPEFQARPRMVDDRQAQLSPRKKSPRLDNELLTPLSANSDADGSIRCRERLGGILKYYYREAA